jgi:hypothetical protein
MSVAAVLPQFVTLDRGGETPRLAYGQSVCGGSRTWWSLSNTHPEVDYKGRGAYPLSHAHDNVSAASARSRHWRLERSVSGGFEDRLR